MYNLSWKTGLSICVENVANVPKIKPYMKNGVYLWSRGKITAKSQKRLLKPTNGCKCMVEEVMALPNEEK